MSEFRNWGFGLELDTYVLDTFLELDMFMFGHVDVWVSAIRNPPHISKRIGDAGFITGITDPFKLTLKMELE
jgi:hypothetical protein